MNWIGKGVGKKFETGPHISDHVPDCNLRRQNTFSVKNSIRGTATPTPISSDEGASRGKVLNRLCREDSTTNGAPVQISR